MEVLSKINPVLNNVKEYIGIYQTVKSDYVSILSAAVGKYSIAIYSDYEKLTNAMSEFGATQVQIAKVHMMTMVDGFREVLEIDERIQKVDIDRYVQNAVKQTGFNVAQVFELSSAIIASLGIDAVGENVMYRNTQNGTTGYVVPMSAYENELMPIAQKMKSGNAKKLDSNDMTRLAVLAKAGVPKAKYYLGYCLLQNEEFEKNAPLGLQYLEEAAADGEALAAGALADYYYEQADSDSWSHAYSFYTGIGSLAINKKRRERIVDIINSRKFNIKTIIASSVLLLAMFVAITVAPASATFTAYRVWGYILFAIALAVFAAAIAHHRQKPYDNLLWVPCAEFIIWTLHFLIRIVF